MYKPVTIVEVRLWGKAVGAVALDPRLGYYAFEYQPPFIRSGLEIAPLTMPLAAAHDPFVFTDLPENTYWRLPGLLADALPDDFGNTLIEAWMAREGVAKPQITPLDRLAYMGQRGMGALEFKPLRGPKQTAKPSVVDMSVLVQSAREAVHGTLNSDHHAEAALAQILQVGTSAGGARAKAVVSWNAQTGEIRTGQFEVPPGFEHWLIKFDGIGPDDRLGAGAEHGRIEYAYSLMARAAGIRMAPTRLLEENGRAHFMTQRFDRKGNTKHHLQTLCGLAHLDYRQKGSHDASLFLLAVQHLRLDYEAMEEAFRRVAFNVMAANCDDHTKNISFLLKEGGTWSLAPAYDVTHAYNPHGEWTHQHLMSVNGKFRDIARDDLLVLAETFSLGTAPVVLKQVALAVDAWTDFSALARVSAEATARVRSHLQVL